jgi:hypothetical protein
MSTRVFSRKLLMNQGEHPPSVARASKPSLTLSPRKNMDSNALQSCYDAPPLENGLLEE